MPITSEKNHTSSKSSHMRAAEHIHSARVAEIKQKINDKEEEKEKKKKEEGRKKD